MDTKTFDRIMVDMLNRVPNTLDKQQGSIIWDALSPAAVEMAEMYAKLAEVYNLGFVQTSVGEYLTELSFQFGISRLQPTKAVRSADFNINVPIGSRFSVENSQINFKVIEKHGTVWKLECESSGTVGNMISGRLLPIDYIQGLESATLGDVLVPGEDEEDDDSLRERTIAHITRPQQDGNVDQYLKWASEFKGIGTASVVPLWNGANTVKVIITNSDGEVPSTELVAAFQTFLDPNIQGKGEGKAPIGAFVKVEAASTQGLAPAITIVYDKNYNVDNVKEQCQAVLQNYAKTATNQKMFKSYEASDLIDQVPGVLRVSSFGLANTVPLSSGKIFTVTGKFTAYAE